MGSESYSPNGVFPDIAIGFPSYIEGFAIILCFCIRNLISYQQDQNDDCD